MGIFNVALLTTIIRGRVIVVLRKIDSDHEQREKVLLKLVECGDLLVYLVFDLLV